MTPHPAFHFLRRHTQGVLQLPDRVEPVRYVIDPATGLPILATQPDVLEVESLTLHIPDESPLSLQLLAEPTSLNPDIDASCDRFLIYLGQPKGRNLRAWVRLGVIGVRYEAELIDPTHVCIANAFLAEEPAACRRANATPDRLRAACRRAGAEVPTPLLVGIDPWGADVRATFGIVRIEWPDAPVTTIDQGLAYLLND